MEQREPSAAARSDDAPGEVALRDHVRALIAWRRETLLAAGLAALAGVLSTLVLEPEYDATATVAIVRSRAEAFAEGVQGQAATDLYQEATGARRTALLGLVHHTSVARSVVETLGERLTEAERELDDVLDSVSTTSWLAIQEQDLIPIEVTAPSPEKAAAIANAWAESYVREVNGLYASVPLGATAMSAELSEAREAYLDAQRDLEGFIAASERTWLEQRILELEERLRVRLTLDLLLDDARGLLAQIEGGSEAGAASNAVAILVLKVRVFASSVPAQTDSAAPDRRRRGGRPSGGPEDPPDYSLETHQNVSVVQASPNLPNLSVELDELGTDRAGQIAEVETLIETIEERRRRLDAAPADLLSGWHAGAEAGEDPNESAAPAPSTGGTERSFQLLLARLDAVTAAQEELEEERDLRRDALAALRDTRMELNLANLIYGEEVRLASPAVPPKGRPWWLRAMTHAGVGVALGLLASTLLALAANSLGARPFLEGRRLAG